MRVCNILACILLFVLSSCGNSANESLLIVGTSADNPPYSFMDGEEVVGFEVDLINKIAQEMGVEVEVKNMPFDGLIQSLLRGDVDLIIAGLTKTEERSEVVDFSEPYYKSNMALLIRDGVIINSLQDLSGKVVGAQLASTWLQEAQNIAIIINNVEVRVLNNNLLLVEELKAGKVDAVILETPQVEKFIMQNKQFSKFDLQDTQSSLSIAFKKNASLRQKVDKVILELNNSGYIQKLGKKWLGL